MSFPPSDPPLCLPLAAHSLASDNKEMLLPDDEEEWDMWKIDLLLGILYESKF